MPVLEPSGRYEDSGHRATARFADRDLGRLPLSRRRFLGDRFLCLLLARDRHQHFLPAGRCLPRLLGNLLRSLGFSRGGGRARRARRLHIVDDAVVARGSARGRSAVRPAAGSPVAYLDAPEFSKFVADDSARLIAAVKKIGKVE
jgi:hypothetical protein